MKLVPTSEQTDFTAALRDLFTDACPPSLVREMKTADSDGFPARLWQALTGMGAFGLTVDPEFGGEGAGLYELGLLFSEAGRVLCPTVVYSTLLFGVAGLLRAGRMRNLRLVSFMVVWLTAEIVALVLLFGLWIVSGFGGRLHTEAYQRKNYAIVRWFLDALYRGAERTYGLRIEIDEPEQAGLELAAEHLAGLRRPVIVLSRHAGPGDSFLLVQQLLSVYGRRPRIVMNLLLQ